MQYVHRLRHRSGHETAKRTACQKRKRWATENKKNTGGPPDNDVLVAGDATRFDRTLRLLCHPELLDGTGKDRLASHQPRDHLDGPRIFITEKQPVRRYPKQGRGLQFHMADDQRVGTGQNRGRPSIWVVCVCVCGSFLGRKRQAGPAVHRTPSPSSSPIAKIIRRTVGRAPRLKWTTSS